MSVRKKVIEAAAKAARIDGGELAFMAEKTPERHSIDITLTFEDNHKSGHPYEGIKAFYMVENFDPTLLEYPGKGSLVDISVGNARQELVDLKTSAEFYREASLLQQSLFDTFFNEENFMAKAIKSWVSNAVRDSLERFENICRSAGLAALNSNQTEKD